MVRRRRSRISSVLRRAAVPQLRARPAWTERSAAQEVVRRRPGAGGLVGRAPLSTSLDPLTNQAYWLVHPAGPRYPNFYEKDDLPFVESWVRIRDYVDAFLFGSSPGTVSSVAVQTLGVPFAQGTGYWPVISTDPRGCTVNFLAQGGQAQGMIFQRFGAPRGSTDPVRTPTRNHIGHDCIANPGDLVIAPQAGTVTAVRPFYAGTEAVYLHTDNDLTMVLGEIEAGSAATFGVGPGSRVAPGQRVARVGAFQAGAGLSFHMLHFEIWRGRREASGNWYDNQPQPPDLLNPTVYLMRADCRRPSGGGGRGPTTVSAAGLQALGRAVMAIPSPQFPH